MGKKAENNSKEKELKPTNIRPTINSDNIVDFNGSYGEMVVYHALRNANLPPKYTVFYSLQWSSGKYINDPRQIYETDFVILHKEYGMLVIEVKSDRLMKKNGKFYPVDSHNNIKKDSEGNDREAMDPMKQAIGSQQYFIRQLSQTLEGFEDQNCIVEPAVWLTSAESINDEDLPGNWRGRILFRDALKDPRKYIEEIFRGLKSKEGTYLDDNGYEKIVEKLSGDFRIMPSLNTENEEFVRLTAEQYLVLDYMKNFREVKIQGAAGTGKTWIAIEKARRLAKTLSEDEKVLFLCYNTILKDSLFDLKKIGVDEKIDIYNIDSFLRYVVPKDSKNNVDWNRGKWRKQYKHFIIDEAQDQADSVVRNLRELAKERNGAFYVFYDENQFVQGKPDDYPVWLKSKENSVELTINCRNTRCIAGTSVKLVNIEQTVKGPEGRIPEFFICSSNNDAREQIVRLLDKYTSEPCNCKPGDICILSLKPYDDKTSVMSQYQNHDGKLGRYNVTSDTEKKGSVLFTTVRKFKGLEASVVIMVDAVPKIFTAEAFDNYKVDPVRQRSLFYVGASRARNCLDVVFVGEEENDVAGFANSLCDPKEMTQAAADQEKGIKLIEEKLAVKCKIFQPEKQSDKR